MRARLLVLALFAALAASLMFSRGVWAPDEARYAEVSREMKDGGEWLIPRLNGERYTEKPPLFFALTRAFAAGSAGIPEWSAKAPSLLSALGTLLIVGWLGRRLVGGAAGWTAPLLLASMGKFIWQSQFGQIDMVVTLLVAAQVGLGWHLGTGAGARLPGIAGLVALGFMGILTKGPVTCLFPWLILMTYFSLRGEPAAVRRLGLPWVILCVAVLTGLWLGAAGLEAGWDYPRTLVVHQTLQRFADPWHHREPWYYYLGVVFADGLPHSLLLIPLLFGLRKRGSWKDPAVLLPLCWMLAYLLILSLSAGKRSVYLLPLYPAMALLLARGFEGWEERTLPLRGFRLALAVLAAVLGASILYAWSNIPGDFRGFLPWLVAGGGLAFAGALGGLLLSSRPRRSLVSVASGVGLFVLVTLLPGTLRLDAVKRPSAFLPEGERALKAGGQVGILPTLVPSVNYYFRTVTPQFGHGEQEPAAAFLAAGPANRLLVESGAWKGPPPPHRILAFGPIGDRTFELWAPPAETAGAEPSP